MAHSRVTCNGSPVLSPRTTSGAALTCYSLHLGAPCLDAALGQALLGDDAADVIREDERGLQDRERLRVRAGGRLVDDDVQGSAVILDSSHLHILHRSRRQVVKETG